jgi:hypothetical protein
MSSLHFSNHGHVHVRVLEPEEVVWYKDWSKHVTDVGVMRLRGGVDVAAGSMQTARGIRHMLRSSSATTLAVPMDGRLQLSRQQEEGVLGVVHGFQRDNVNRPWTGSWALGKLCRAGTGIDIIRLPKEFVTEVVVHVHTMSSNTNTSFVLMHVTKPGPFNQHFLRTALRTVLLPPGAVVTQTFPTLCYVMVP